MKKLQLNGNRIWSVSARRAAIERRIQLVRSVGLFLVGSWLGLMISGFVAFLVLQVG